jgi:hypothetical protein
MIAMFEGMKGWLSKLCEGRGSAARVRIGAARLITKKRINIAGIILKPSECCITTIK